MSSTKNEPRVLLSIDNGIALVTLNRGSKYNGLDNAMVEGIITTIKKIKANNNIRAVILNANGKAFCTGLDVMSAKSEPLFIPNVFFKFSAKKISNKVQDIAYLWRTLDIPVIAVTHGKCLGGGLQIAMGADFRISTPDCEFSILEVKWGLIPDMGGALTFREVMRRDELRQLTFTGEIFSAERAYESGLITEISNTPMNKAKVLATELLKKDKYHLASVKKALH